MPWLWIGLAVLVGLILGYLGGFNSGYERCMCDWGMEPEEV